MLKDSSIRLAPSILAVWDATHGSVTDKTAACVAAARWVNNNLSDTWLHVDVMDGRYVPATTFGPELVAALRQAVPSLHLNVHLMVAEADIWLADMARAGASSLCVHPKTTANLEQTINNIQELGLGAGVALNLPEPAELLAPVAGHLHHALVMSVPAGAGGQPFRPEELPKIAEVRRLVGSGVAVVADGGIKPGTAPLTKGAGANVLVAGSAIFGQTDWKLAVAELERAVA